MNCGHVKASRNDSQRYHKLIKALNLPACTKKPYCFDFSDVFALDDFELGRTSVVCHSIDTGDHKPIKQQPY